MPDPGAARERPGQGRCPLIGASVSTSSSRRTSGSAASHLWWAHGLALVLFLAAFAYASAGGLRGSDQYWYVADVETLLSTGRAVTNNVFPVSLLNGETLPLPFVHNVLSVYLATVPAFFLGSYWGWLVLNLAGTLICCVLVHRTCRRFADERVALLASLAYLTFPLTFWQAVQPLGEASIPPLIALALLLLARAGTAAHGWLALAFAAALLYFSRQSLVLVLLAVPVGYALRTWGGAWRPRAMTLAGLLLIVAGALVIGNLLFEQEAVELTYARVLSGVVPGVAGHEDNMASSFDLSPANLAGGPPVRLDFLMMKVEAALRQQLVDFSGLPQAGIYWAFNGLALLTLAALWRFRRDPDRFTLVAGAVVLLGVHAITIAVHQNQARYLLIPLPGVIVASSLLLGDLLKAGRRRRVISGLAALLVLLALPFQLLAAHASHSEGRAEQQAVAEVRALAERHLDEDEPVMVTWLHQEQAIAYALRPRPVLFVRPDYALEQYQALSARLPVRWLIATTDAPAPAILGVARDGPVATFTLRDQLWGLFRLPDEMRAGGSFTGEGAGSGASVNSPQPENSGSGSTSAAP